MPGTVAPNRVLRGRYRLIRELSEGEWTTVWEARDAILDRPVAIKVLHPALGGHPAVVDRFHREAVAAGALTHPNLVATYDTGVEDGVDFVVTELVPGRSLAQLLAERRWLPPRDAVAIAIQIADGLAAAHGRGAAHRGFQASDVLVRADGCVKVAGFGPASDGDTAADVVAAVQILHDMLAGGPPAPTPVLAVVATAFSSATELATALRATGADRSDATPSAGIPVALAIHTRRTRPAVVAVLLGLIVAALVAVAVTSPRHLSITGHRAPATGTPIRIVGAVDFDPNGNGREHPETAARAIDGKPATGWTTESYRSRDLATFKGGVGLIVDLGRSTTVRRVELDSAGDWSGQIYVAQESGLTLADWGSPAAAIAATSGTTNVVLDHAANGRYVLVWVTRLPASLALQLDEVRVAG